MTETARTDFIFLHGGVQGGWVWAEAIEALKERGGERVGECLALDIPGCGLKRGRDTSAMRFDDIVTDLVIDIDAANLRDAVLVGHSQAGSVLPRLIEARPGLFRQVIYVSCLAPEPGANVLVGTLGRDIDEAELPDPASMMDRFRTMFCSDMDDAEANAFLARLGQDNWPRASYAETGWRYDHLAAVPSTYVVCLDDRCLEPAWQKAFAGRFGARRIVSLPAGHQVMNSQPEALAELLLAEASSTD